MLVEGKVAIVLGGAGGIGKACCRALLTKGAKVCCADVADESTIADIYGEFPAGQILFFRCDSTKEADIKELFETTARHFGKLPEIVITTVAIIDESNWERCVNVNLNGSIRLVNTALSKMAANKGGNGGSLVLLSSVSGFLAQDWGPVYAATKHGIIGLMRGWAEESHFSQHRIRFNCLCPGAVDTPFLGQIGKAYFSDEHQTRLNNNPRLPPASVADAFIRITEDDSINGASIVVSTKNPFEFLPYPHLDL